MNGRFSPLQGIIIIIYFNCYFSGGVAPTSL